MSRVPMLFIFNSPLSSGCDYVLQTIRIVAKRNPVYGIALGDTISLLRWLLSGDRWIVRLVEGATIIRPVSILPFIRFRIVKLFTYSILSLGIRLWLDLKYFRQRKVLWFFEPFYTSSLLLLFQRYISVYDCVDYFSGFNSVANREHIAVMDNATHVFANSGPLALALKKLRPDVQQVPLGFATELFSGKPRKYQNIRNDHMTIGFVGSISDRIDFNMLVEAARSLPYVRFEFVGPVEKDVFGYLKQINGSYLELIKEKNVVLRGRVTKAEIPKIISRFDICLIPYDTRNLFNRLSFPMKTLEYFAAGKPVVATEIETLKPYKKAGLIYTISSIA